MGTNLDALRYAFIARLIARSNINSGLIIAASWHNKASGLNVPSKLAQRSVKVDWDLLRPQLDCKQPAEL